MRFESAAPLLSSGRRLADVATAAGFFDQPHLNQEWRALTGLTPLQWLGDELRDLDDHELP